MKSETTHRRWLTRTVLGIGIASFFSDLGHEAATAILPMFLASIGAAPAALGIIEGVSDAIASFSKLGAGWFSDRLPHRKPMAVTGYALTAIAKGSFALATSWVHVLFGRTIAWFGRGIRGPVRDAIMTDSVPSEARGRAFGFDRALDTLGAVAGPIAALALVGLTSYRVIFALAMIPGLFAALSFGTLVREPARQSGNIRSFRHSLRELPPEFRRYLIAIAVFGAGDFAHTLLILRATQLLTGAGVASAPQLAVSLYVVHNIIYAAASYPIGALGDRFGKRTLLAGGYLLSGIMCALFLTGSAGYALLFLAFVVGGLYVAIEDSLERALAADLLPSDLRGTGFGVLAAVNGMGDFVSSILVGFLWTSVSPASGFLYSLVTSVVGAGLVLRFVGSKSMRENR